jgi:predicted  nucleic acid-binding Zn-ribbon protein
MKAQGTSARKARKLRASRDLWKQRSAEKQQQIRQLRVTVRDLSTSREHWKTRVKDLEQQLQTLQAAQDARSAVGPGIGTFFGGSMNQRTVPLRLSCLLSD